MEKVRSAGFTIVELIIGIFVLSIVSVSILQLSASLTTSARYAKYKAVSLTLATNKMEYLKSLPYDSLAIAGGTIYSASPLPATEDQTIDGFTYTVKSDIDYVDDAFDGCASYPNTTIAQQLCRGYPAPTGSPTDTNPKDYKVLTVTVVLKSNGKQLASVSTNVSARVAETSSTTGGMVVKVIDQSGSPVTGANVTVVNSTVTPSVNQSDNTDINGIAIFYDLPPDTTNYDYNVTASKSGYATLTTIPPTASLIPYYSNQQILTQQSSQVTLMIDKKTSDSLLLEVMNTSGTTLSNAKIYTKGSYKKYNSTTDLTYYFNNFSPDTRTASDASGLISMLNLDPGTYIFCGEDGTQNCVVGSTTNYLVAAVPATGDNPYGPIVVPAYDTSLPTFSSGGRNYIQKVGIVLSSNSSFPRIKTLSPDEISRTSPSINNFDFIITGKNLPCSSVASSCSTTVKLLSGASTYTASCTGSAAGTSISCTIDLTGISAGQTQLQVSSGGNTYTSPTGYLGGVNVLP